MTRKKIAVYTIPWLLVIILSLAGSYFNSILLDTTFYLKRELPFLSRWIVWMPLTGMAVYFADKTPYRENKLSLFVWYHIAVYLLLCVVHILAASSLATFINYLQGVKVDYVTVLRKCALASFFFNAVIYAIIVLLTNWMKYYYALRLENLKTLSLQQSLSESQLMFLKQQLQPHFLFNTHHSILTLIKLGDREKAASMLEKLSDLMRITLNEAGEQKVPLHKELDTLKLYVDIQKIRFEDKMDVVYAIADDVKNALVPGMILQPLVENAIKYAVERSVSASAIRIQVATAGSQLLMIIRDTGTGKASPEVLKRGVGLTNTEERLSRLYGKASSLIVGPYQAGGSIGLEVAIQIPLQYAAA